MSIKEKFKITFDPKSKELILNAFNKTIDAEGYIVEKDKPSQRVLTPDGEEIRLEEWAGILKGSQLFIKNDIFSLVKYADKII